MNIERTTIVLVPETGYKRTITLKLVKAQPYENGLFKICHKGCASHVVKHKNPRFIIVITDGNGQIARETNQQMVIGESRVEMVKKYNELVNYYKVMAYCEEHPEEKPNYQNGGWYNGGGYIWPIHPWKS